MFNHIHRTIKFMAVVAGASMLAAMTACSTAPDTAEGRTAIRRDATSTLSTAERNDPSLKTLIDKSIGHAVFPTIGKGAIGIGGAYGKGVLFEGSSAIGYCDLSQATIGFQLGGQSYSEIIVFNTKDALFRFKGGSFEFGAQATAVALHSGAGANAKFRDGVAVFTMNEAGLMYEASIGGQKFSYQPDKD